MTYNGFTLKVTNGTWSAFNNGVLIAEGTKDEVFSILDAIS